jgi:carboxyl-terminal processing protease
MLPTFARKAYKEGTNMNQDAMTYLNEALNYIQDNSVMKERIDWPTLRQEMSALAALAQTPAETYPAIKKALELLGDHHSHFRSPASVQLLGQGQAKQLGLRIIYPEGIIGLVYPDSPAEHAGLQVGDHIETING